MDDHIFMAEDMEYLEFITRKLIEEHRKWRYELNIEKNIPLNKKTAEN